MEIVQDKLKVSIAYTLMERSGKILEEVPASHPFVYIHGYNNIIPGLECALLGRHVGEKFTINVSAEQGYGLFRQDLILEVPKDELKEVGEIWLGMELEMYQDEDIREFQLPETADEFVEGLNLDNEDDDEPEVYTIKEIRKETVIVDGNHPFAGKDLTFDVQVVAVETPSFTELESGFPDKDEFDESDGFDEFEDGLDNPDNYNRRWR